MTANQRRPGFRLPWSSEMEAQGGEAAPGGEDQSMTTTPTGDEAATAESTSEAMAPEAPATPEHEPAAEMETPPVGATGDRAAAPAEPASSAAAGAPDEFMRDLVAAMRGVADEARDTGVADVRMKADEQVRHLEEEAERRQQELRDRAEADVAKVGEWEQSEQERIKREAEERVVARRAQLDEQLAADTTRTDAETKALRDRVAEYERELDAYHAQLIEINDPAAFAAAAKRMPKAPSLEASAPVAPAAESATTESPAGSATAESATTESPAGSATTENPAAESATTETAASESAASEGAAPESPAAAAPAPTSSPAVADDQATVEPVVTSTNGVPDPEPDVHPAEEEVLAARLAELDATLPPAQADAPAPTATPTASAESTTTEVVVKGLGSFGAITGFRQALSGVEGVDAVALSLGQTGEFVFRASHAADFDIRDAIAKLEGEGAKIEDRPEGGLRVTLDRAR